MSLPTNKTLALGALLSAALASSGSAAEPKTRVVACKAGSCLLVTGRRADGASLVNINGHAVAVEGSRKWRVSLPVDTVREWSAPYARTITVAVGTDASAEADLPIGLLGHAEDLAMLIVSVK